MNNGRDCEHGRYKKGYCADCEVIELESKLKLTEDNLAFILNNNKNLIIPPTLIVTKPISI